MTYREKIERRIDDFPEMPALSRNLLHSLEDPYIDFSQLEEQIQYDPGLTSNVLRLANSAYFGAAGTVSSLRVALMRLGMRRISEIITAIMVSPMMLPTLPGYELRSRNLLKHSVWVAVASEQLARCLGYSDVKMLFTAGLLHDMGKIILDPFVQEHQSELLEEGQSVSFDARERNILGISHAETGSRLLSRWNIPEEITAAAVWHHEPDSAPEHRDQVFMVHLADMLGYTEGVGTGIDGMKYRVSSDVERKLGLKKSDIEYVASLTLDKMNELESLLR
jgi:putative nucleotidyltransferase with HDIG domain